MNNQLTTTADFLAKDATTTNHFQGRELPLDRHG